jgi:hypothetical protein
MNNFSIYTHTHTHISIDLFKTSYKQIEQTPVLFCVGKQGERRWRSGRKEMRQERDIIRFSRAMT